MIEYDVALLNAGALILFVSSSCVALVAFAYLVVRLRQLIKQKREE